VIENIENAHQLAVILVDLVDSNTKNVAPNNVFHDPYPAAAKFLQSYAQPLPS
jgi:hypothetical protein